jgi:hypothetical protein
MNKEIKTYTATDFANYHAGKMPVNEMYALEKAALSDPFLADALEGYEFANDCAQDIESIKTRLNNPKNKPGLYVSIKKYWVRIAAAAAIFIGVGYLFLNINKKVADNTIAQVKVNNENIITPKINNEVISNYDTTVVVKSNATAELKSKPEQTPIVVDNPKPALIASDTKLNADIPFDFNTKNITPDKSFINVTPSNQGIFNNNINDKIVGGPKPIAQNKNNNQVNFNDALQRSKNLALTDSITSNDLAINNAPQKKEIAQSPTMTEERKDAESLKEVVVNGYSTKAKKVSAQTSSNTVLNGSVAGIDVSKQKVSTLENDFENYAKKNIKPVFDSKGNEIKGTVKLSFKTNKKGQPIKIEVVQSINKDCNNQAISLLKNGPNWLANSKVRKQVEIVF